MAQTKQNDPGFEDCGLVFGMHFIKILDLPLKQSTGSKKTVHDDFVGTYSTSTNEEDVLKLFKTVSIIGAACIFLVACSEQKPVDTGKLKKNEKQNAAEVSKKAPEKPSQVNGTLTHTERGLALVTESILYLVKGKDLSGMIGKKVKITGAIAEVDGNQVIQVMSVMPIK